MAQSMEYSVEQRERFIVNLMRQEFGRQVIGISRLGRDSNNFVHLIELAESVDQPATLLPTVLKPGTSSSLAGATKVVIRISNPQAMLNEDARVQNEVAAMCLARQALATYEDRLIPNTYAWRPSVEGYGWILQEYMTGVQLDKEIPGLDRDLKQGILYQIADVFKLIQSYSLPESVKGYGGLTFNAFGEIVTGPTTIPCGGPFSEFYEMYVQMLHRQLIESDTSERIVGWRRNNLRDRLERFVTSGIAKRVVENSVARQTLVHGDFNTFNMLFDPTSNRLTALLDFDLSHIATPADEYFYSFRTVGALLTGPFEEGDEGQLRQCLLYGFEGNVPDKNSKKVNFEIAQMMDKEFVRVGVLRPADIHGAGELAALKWFLEDVSPPFFFMSRWLECRKPEKIDEIKASIEENLGKYLERWGF
ncbi:kinase-like domain-containing protein [Amylocarpus encephaloides]|uniref:Kinase-like domain-containing protein n=1 Tax=Amylocarpus encephaloides TaxID=45428 RepID=A0A9P7Y932_9HELO|nr:kinase-like domain-containing protein [Amylocarpus encephaloides]